MENVTSSWGLACFIDILANPRDPKSKNATIKMINEENRHKLSLGRDPVISLSEAHQTLSSECYTLWESGLQKRKYAHYRGGPSWFF